MSEVIRVMRNNDHFQQIEVLKTNRKKRYRARKFLVEGVNMLNAVLEHGYCIEGVIYTNYDALSNWAKEMIRQAKPRTEYVMHPDLMCQLSDKEDTSELLALVRFCDDALQDIQLSDIPLLVAMDRPIYPGNLGSMLRSADAFGADAVVVTGHSADIYDPQCVRASVGTVFSMPVITLPSHQPLVDYVQKLRIMYPDFQIVGSSAKTEDCVHDVDYGKPTLILVGNETKGLSNAWKENADHMVKIPIGGSASSLNVSSALSILLYEVQRQRGFEI